MVDFSRIEFKFKHCGISVLVPHRYAKARHKDGVMCQRCFNKSKKAGMDVLLAIEIRKIQRRKK